MRRRLLLMVGPKQPPLPTRAVQALYDAHELAREWLTGETPADPAAVLLEIDSVTGRALVEMARSGR
jgi:hypothetical protein